MGRPLWRFFIAGIVLVVAVSALCWYTEPQFVPAVVSQLAQTPEREELPPTRSPTDYHVTLSALINFPDHPKTGGLILFLEKVPNGSGTLVVQRPDGKNVTLKLGAVDELPGRGPVPEGELIDRLVVLESSSGLPVAMEHVLPFESMSFRSDKFPPGSATLPKPRK